MEPLRDLSQTELASEPAEQAGIFLVTQPPAEETLPAALPDTDYSRVRLFDREGRLIDGAVQRIQKRAAELGKRASGEVVQMFRGFVPVTREFLLKDDRGKPTGETEIREVRGVGPAGVDCILYIREESQP